MLKKYIVSAFFLFSFCIFAYSTTIAIACFQNKDAHEACMNVTGKFEDLLFAPFFDGGVIVTSIPVGEISSKKDIKIDRIRTLFEQPADYILVCRVEYGKSLVIDKTGKKKVPDWLNTEFCLIEFSSGKEIYTSSIKMENIEGNTIEKRTEKVSALIAREVLAKIK